MPPDERDREGPAAARLRRAAGAGASASADLAARLGRRLQGLAERAAAPVLARPDAVGDAVRRANDALGRPLGRAGRAAPAPARGSATASAATPAAAREPAPVVVYTMDKQRRELGQLVELLDAAEVPYRVLSLEDDPAGQAAVRRDSQGKRLPVVFIAGEVVGGRGELLTLGRAGLRARVYGAP